MSPGTTLPLRDIHLPGEPSWWPPAPGWWLLGAVILVLLILGGRYLWLWLRRASLQRQQRRAMQAALREAVAEPDPIHRLRAAVDVLRRACKQTRPSALRLRGEAWLEYLDQGFENQPFSRGAGQLLSDAQYAPSADSSAVDAAIELIAQRLRRGLP